jgi:hypothetical protein
MRGRTSLSVMCVYRYVCMVEHHKCVGFFLDSDSQPLSAESRWPLSAESRGPLSAESRGPSIEIKT